MSICLVGPGNSLGVSVAFPSFTFPLRFRHVSVTFPLGRREPDGNYLETLVCVDVSVAFPLGNCLPGKYCPKTPAAPAKSAMTNTALHCTRQQCARQQRARQQRAGQQQCARQQCAGQQCAGQQCTRQQRAGHQHTMSTRTFSAIAYIVELFVGLCVLVCPCKGKY